MEIWNTLNNVKGRSAVDCHLLWKCWCDSSIIDRLEPLTSPIMLTESYIPWANSKIFKSKRSHTVELSEPNVTDHRRLCIGHHHALRCWQNLINWSALVMFWPPIMRKSCRTTCCAAILPSMRAAGDLQHMQRSFCGQFISACSNL